MEGFQFILESPQEGQSHKKRPRLVTSCDNCRLKKIKCLQPSPESPCEACKVAKVPCRFLDRERYFAERSRAIAGPSHIRLTSGRIECPTHDTPIGPESTFSEYSVQNPMPSSSIQRSSSCSPGPQSIGQHAARFNSGYSYGRQAGQSPQYQPSVLFEPGHPFKSPQRAWMQQFIQLCISNMGVHCPFLSYEEIYDRFRRNSLPPLLSNCIAALGARYSDLPEVVAGDSLVVAETYCNTAKEELSTSFHRPSLDTLQAAILLAWAEYKSGRGHGFRQYSDLAMQTAMAISLSEDLYKTTWASLTQLQLYATSSQKFG